MAVFAHRLPRRTRPHDGARNWLPLLLLTFGFSTVIMLLVDLDRTQQGWITISQGAMADLLRQIGGPK